MPFPMLYPILSFFVASAWVSLATIITERYGTKKGGVITTLPSALVVALFFIGIQEGADFAAETAIVVPAEMGINAIFLAVFITLIKHGLPKALTGAMAAWFLLSFSLLLLLEPLLIVTLGIYSLCVVSMIIWLRKRHRYRAQPGKKVYYAKKEIMARGLFAGILIALAIFLANIGGPVLGGIFSVFPAIFTSTMVILYLKQGPEFTGATGSTMVLGSVNVVFYSVLVSYSYPWLGVINGTIVSLVLGYLWAFGLFTIITRNGC